MTDDALINVRLSLPVELRAPTVVSVPYKPVSLSGLVELGFSRLAEWIREPKGMTLALPRPSDDDLCVLRLCGLEIEDEGLPCVRVLRPREWAP